jgi:hypothetical protein
MFALKCPVGWFLDDEAAGNPCGLKREEEGTASLVVV